MSNPICVYQEGISNYWKLDIENTYYYFFSIVFDIFVAKNEEKKYPENTTLKDE